MDPLLEQLFLDHCVYTEQQPSESYAEACCSVSALQDKVAEALGRPFSEDLWYAHSQLSLVEMRASFLFGLRLARAILTA